MSGGPFRTVPVDLSAPTPQNTPASAAPISSRAQQPGVSSISEEDDRMARLGGIIAQNPVMVEMMQRKLNHLIGKSSGYIEGLPADVRRRINGLKGIQKDHAKLEAQFQEEVLELEKKFFKLYTPLYERRAKIINGDLEPTNAEVTEGEKEPKDDDEDEEVKGAPAAKAAEEEKPSEPTKGIPEFWLSTLKQNPSIQEMIMEDDEPVLRSLTDIRMEYLDKPGFRLLFDFANNEYFEDKTLSKTYYYREENGYGGDFIYDHAEGCKVSWKKGKDLTVRIESKKQRNKNTKQTRIVKKTVPAESFFNFFSPPVAPGPEDEEEASEELEERLELDYQLGEDIKEKIIPRAVDWFTGQALMYEGFGDIEEEEYDEEDDEDEEDESDDGDEDEEESDDEDSASKPKQDAAECKQS